MTERLFDLDSHRAGRAGHDFHGGFDIVGIQVWQFLGGDLLQLSLGDRADLGEVGLTGTFLFGDSLEDQARSRRGLQDEAVSAVFVYGDDDRDHVADHALGGVVELLGEIADIYSGLSQSGAQWRRWSGLAGRCENFYLFDDFLCQGIFRLIRLIRN